MAETLEFIKTVGVPAAIAFFVLWRLDRRLGDLVGAITSFHADLKDAFENVVTLRQDIKETGDRVIRETEHNFRTAVAQALARFQ